MSAAPHNTASPARLAAWEWLLGCAWVGWFVSRVLARPLCADEAFFAYVARQPLSAFAHPPCYLQLLRVVYLLMHPPATWLRLIGVVTLAATAIVTYGIAERWEPRGGRWALGLLLTSPLMLQGAVLLDIDNTILTWWTITSIWWVMRTRWPLRWPSLLGLSAWWALGLWMKLTTPLLWPPVIGLIYVSRGLTRRGVRDVLLLSAIGLALFLGAWTWYAMAHAVPWDAIFSGRTWAVLRRGASDTGSSVWRELGERAVRIGVWIGPVMLLLWGWATRQAWKARAALAHREAWLAALALGWAILLGYWIVGGVIWSVARYHIPGLPVYAAVCGAMVARLTQDARLPRTVTAALIGLAVAGALVLVGDPVYLVNYTLRHALLTEPARVPQQLLALGGRIVGMLGVVAVVAGWLWWRRTRWQLNSRTILGLALGISAMGLGAGLLVLQARADYSTTYTYGRPVATYAAAQRCAMRVYAADPDAQLMVPFDTIQAALPNTEFRRVIVNEWYHVGTPEALLDALSNPRLALVVIDPDFSWARTVRDVWHHPRVRDALQRDFIRVPLGTAEGWARPAYAALAADAS